MKKQLEVKKIAVIAEMSDGQIYQMLMTKDEQMLWLSMFSNFYKPIKFLKTPIDGVIIKNHEQEANTTN